MAKDICTMEIEQAMRDDWQETRRERIATAALSGCLSDPGYLGTKSETAADCVSYADALIAELDRETDQ